MTTSVSSTNGGAVSKSDRVAVMSRAWAIFRETYKYPSIKFSSIGRPCFGWALRKAWAEAREAARIAAIPQAAKVDRIAALTNAITFEAFNDYWPAARANIAQMRTEISQLSA